MYQYLKAIGFGQYNTRKKLKELLEYIKEKAERKECFQLNEEETIYSYEKEVGEGIGVAMIEIKDKTGYSEIDSFFPYVRGMNYLFHQGMEFEHFSNQEGFACICDENNLGIPLIFHVNNVIEYLKMKSSDLSGEINSVTLSAISTKGIIILPVEKNEQQRKVERRDNEIRNEMIDAAKAGDIEAMEQLALEDMDTYTLVSNRSKREDLFTIVTSYFMPYTVECDKYSVLGNIIDVSEIQNRLTGEMLYYISLECNSIQIEFTIAKSDITGVPEIGRRFKGYLWLQGEVDSL